MPERKPRVLKGPKAPGNRLMRWWRGTSIYREWAIRRVLK